MSVFNPGSLSTIADTLRRPDVQNGLQTSDFTTTTPSDFVLMPGTSRYLYLERSPLSTVSALASEVLSASSHDFSSFLSGTDQHLPEVNKAELALPSPGTIRFLLGRYNQRVLPQYDILDPSILHHDGMNIKKLPDLTRFEILLACAIAAMNESYCNPSWRAVAQTCRDLADELIGSLVSTGTAQSLTCVLLLLIFELVDPSRALTWDLLDLVARNLLQLGWHRDDHFAELSNDPSVHGTDFKGDERLRLTAAVKDIHGCVQNSDMYLPEAIALTCNQRIAFHLPPLEHAPWNAATEDYHDRSRI